MPVYSRGVKLRIYTYLKVFVMNQYRQYDEYDQYRHERSEHVNKQKCHTRNAVFMLLTLSRENVNCMQDGEGHHTSGRGILCALRTPCNVSSVECPSKYRD